MSDGYDADLVVIGAGTGGQSVARACASEGWSVVIVDERPYGGTCALRGCDPKKMLVGVTEAADWARRMDGRGLRVERLGFDWSDLMAFKRSFTDQMPDRIEEGLEKHGVETLHGTAAFVGPNEVRIDDRVIAARHVHIATGARPRTLGIPGEELVSTSTDFLELEHLPGRITFIGGGFISFEFAHIAKRAGAASVAIVHRGARPLEGFDPDLVALQTARTRELGVEVVLGAEATAIERNDDGLILRFDSASGSGSGSGSVESDLVVHGAGRVPDIDSLDLAAGGVGFGPRGVTVNRSMRSVSNPSVFAAGDAADTGAPALTPVSANEARVAFKNLLAGEDVRTIEYPPIPSVVFTVPPLARVGMLETEAAAAGLDVEVHQRETGDWYSSLRVAETHTAYKTIVEKGTKRIVGAHVMGPGAEEQINLLAMAMGAGMTANDLKGVVFAYPSFASDLASMI